MKTEGRVILLSNAGVVLYYQGTRIIIDGLYKDLRDYFTDLPAGVWQLMKGGKGDLADAEYVFFTHSHFDHYYSPYFFDYMKNNKVKALILPPLDDTKGLKDAYEQYGRLNLPYEENETITLENDIKLTVIRIRHVDKLYHFMPVLCFLFEVANTKLLITSDADFDKDSFQSLVGIAIDYVFVTPVFYNNKLGREILYDYLKVKKIIVYHLPNIEDDKYMYYKMVTRDVEKYAKGDEVIIWNRFGQYISFGKSE